MCKLRSSPNDSAALIRSQVFDAVHEEACYDSDPETYPSSRTSLSVSAFTEDTSNKENKYITDDFPDYSHLHSKLSDDYAIRQMVQVIVIEAVLFYVLAVVFSAV